MVTKRQETATREGWRKACPRLTIHDLMGVPLRILMKNSPFPIY